MDKQKQILSNHEEISELANALYGMQGEFDMSNPYEVGYVLINKLGYRKIPEGAVVLTREAYERLCDLAYFGNGQEIVRKETAEKFAERLKENTVDEYDSEGVNHPYVILDYEELDEICKEFTEDKDEKG